jgi:uncharacterized protein
VTAMPELVERLRSFFSGEPSVILAYLFGSQATGRVMRESDIDVAVYLGDRTQEARLWRGVSERCERDVDLVLLNDAPATLVSAVLKTGVALAIKDRGLSLDLYLAVSAEAEDFAGFAVDYARVAARSRSLTPEDRTRLVRRIGFLREELAELAAFAEVGIEAYRGSRSRRREMERWAENIANATIDIAKIVLGSQGGRCRRATARLYGTWAAAQGFPVMTPAAWKTWPVCATSSPTSTSISSTGGSAS